MDRVDIPRKSSQVNRPVAVDNEFLINDSC